MANCTALGRHVKAHGHALGTVTACALKVSRKTPMSGRPRAARLPNPRRTSAGRSWSSLQMLGAVTDRNAAIANLHV
jgi:hypothetical protein